MHVSNETATRFRSSMWQITQWPRAHANTKQLNTASCDLLFGQLQTPILLWTEDGSSAALIMKSATSARDFETENRQPPYPHAIPSGVGFVGQLRRTHHRPVET